MSSTRIFQIFGGLSALVKVVGQMMPNQFGGGVGWHGGGAHFSWERHNPQDDQCLVHRDAQSCLDTAISVMQGASFGSFGSNDNLIRTSKLLEQYVSHFSWGASDNAKGYVHIALANVYWQIGNYGKAYEHLNSGKKLNPSKFRNEEIGMGYSGFKIVDLLRKAKNPNAQEVYVTYGPSGIETPTFKTKKSAKKGIETEQDPAAMLTKAADIISKRGNTKESEKYLKRAVKQDASLAPIAEKVRNKNLTTSEDITRDIVALRQKENNRGQFRAR